MSNQEKEEAWIDQGPWGEERTIRTGPSDGPRSLSLILVSCHYLSNYEPLELLDRHKMESLWIPLFHPQEDDPCDDPQQPSVGLPITNEP